MCSAVIYSVPLPPLGVNENHQGRLHREAEFQLRDTDLLKDMDPYSGRALMCCSSTSIQILHWYDDNRRSTISIEQDVHDERVSIMSLARYASLRTFIPQWNGIASLRFCGPYILCFRGRSVEAYPVPTVTSMANPLPMLRHRFGQVYFQVVSLSHVRASRCPSGEAYTIFMLTCDVSQGKGMFHYRIRVTTSPIPSMSVQVLARGSIHISPPPPIPGTDIRYTSEDIISQVFVATWSLGSAGLRGVWVDRRRGSIDRRVVVFTTHPSRLRTKVALSVPGEGFSEGDTVDVEDEVPSMDGKVIHVNSSYDLRGRCGVCIPGFDLEDLFLSKDDITICAVSEWTGRIALGSRVGAISLL